LEELIMEGKSILRRAAMLAALFAAVIATNGCVLAVGNQGLYDNESLSGPGGRGAVRIFNGGVDHADWTEDAGETEELKSLREQVQALKERNEGLKVDLEAK